MKKLLFLVAAAIAVVMYPVYADEPSGFAKKVELSLSDTAKEALGEGAFDNVPVLVKLSAAIQGFSYEDFMGERGADMLFTDETGAVVPHEIDTWDPEGESLVWLKPSSLSAALGKITMYFGCADAPVSTVAQVWSGYTGVWHFDEASTLTAEQATT